MASNCQKPVSKDECDEDEMELVSDDGSNCEQKEICSLDTHLDQLNDFLDDLERKNESIKSKILAMYMELTKSNESSSVKEEQN